MDQSYSDNDISLSPSQILERLHTLRQLQLLQRGKLQKQCLNYQDSPENSSITEIVSRFSSSTSYNTFRSLLESADALSNEVTPRSEVSGISKIVGEKDLIDGVSLLNLSQESEIIVNSPISATSQLSAPPVPAKHGNVSAPLIKVNSLADKKRISLDEMPILSPKKDFEALIIEKLNADKKVHKNPQSNKLALSVSKKTFLRRGQGMSRFGIGKQNLVIQTTNSLPWKKNSAPKQVKSTTPPKEKTKNSKVNIEILITEPKKSDTDQTSTRKINSNENELLSTKLQDHKIQDEETTIDSSNCELHCPIKKPDLVSKINELKSMVSQKHPLKSNKGKTWAAVLTKEQDDFLRQLKQSDYYKNFASPAKSIVSDISCNENMSNLTNAHEAAEQNMFELLERKATHESFSLENSFINRFIRNRNLECSGESTPLIMQRCLSDNPNLMHIFPELNHKRNQRTQSEADTCESVCSDCCNDASSSVSSCCSCKTIENNESQKEPMNKNSNKSKVKTKSISVKESKSKEDVKQTDTDTVSENDIIKANMEEMNAKLIATSDLLKDRLRELEDEIETFRKENANLTKMREDIDMERQKFYEEKQAFEQKFNEEKILSEYYLADEKEKLSKQKQMYERYVREMRGRLNKKDKDEVVNLKKEISDLKDDIRLKDAKSTSTIARLRNQIKIMEKENKALQEEAEKLKKENRRIQHSNEISRRLTNMKYLEEINKKLSHMAKETQSEVDVDRDVKYKAFEIERQSRNRKVPNAPKPGLRSRAKSVPNLKVTSRYAKYFSQRDAASEVEKDAIFIESLDVNRNGRYNDKENLSDCASLKDDESQYSETDNNLERLYTERFQSVSPKSSRSSLTDSSNIDKSNSREHYDDFFIQKSKRSKSPAQNSTSPYLRTSTTSNLNASNSPLSTNSYKSTQKSPTYVRKIRKSAELNLSDQSNKSRKSPISHLRPNSGDINQNKFIESGIVLSPEPTASKSSLAKTNLNPTELRKPDGSRELRFPNGNAKFISADGKYTKFVYYNGDVKENFLLEGRIKYYYAENKTVHTTHADGLEVLEFADGQVEKRYKDGSSEIRLPNGSVRYYDPKNQHVREEWRFPDGAALTVSANGEQRIVFTNGQIEVHAKDHKRREFPDGTVKLVYNDGTSETRYSSGRVRIKDKHGNLIMDSAPG